MDTANQQTNDLWLYYRLTGSAKIEKEEDELIKVTLLNEAGNPDQPPLRFDSPLNFSTKDNKVIESITINELARGGVIKKVDFDAAFDEAWFKASKDEGFKFVKKDGVSPLELFNELEKPDGDPMSVVRPKVKGSSN